ncbi:MAG TPA: C4-dicarboxylate ABC transporter substrate-binding protein [Firmicutes bacterium]|nr:C4-dicarboxylate ABC transporter substrate-binding protein [Bacillota bacterium]
MKIIIGLMVLLLVLLPVFAGCAPRPAPEPVAPAPAPAPPEPGQEWTLDFATFWPATDFQFIEGHEAWTKTISDRVAAETNHTINFAMHPGGVLLGPKELLQGVAAGAADIVTTAPAYTPGTHPLTEVFELPGFKNDNALVASLTVHEAWKQSQAMQQEYDDVKIMFFWATGPGDFMTSAPVRTLQDLAGKEIRAVGGTVPSVTALGATPVSMPMSDAYMALDGGIVDGILAPTDTLQGFKLAEVTGYITKTPFVYNIVFVKAMNLDTWNAFPPEVQKIFDEVNEEFVRNYGELRTDYTVAGQEYAVKEFGHEVIELTANEHARWLEVLKPITDAWIKKTNAANLPGTEIFELVSSLDAKFSQEHGAYGR